ncbi:MAG: outer membrane beta-barrel protein [Kofleriaceae bacterium]
MRTTVRLSLCLSTLARVASAQPTEPPPAKSDAETVEPAKPIVTVGGYLETYYQLNLRVPSNQITSLRGYDNRDRTFTLANAAIDLKGERGPLTARLIFQVGATGSTYYLGEPPLPGATGVNATNSELWKYIQTATLAYHAPADVLVEAGLFLSPIGPEVIPIKDNWSYSRSNLFFGLPAYHTGARASRSLGGNWTGTLAMYSGWNSVVDNNRTPSVSVSASHVTPKLTAQLLYFGGNERAPGSPEGTPWRHLVDAYAQLAIDDRFAVLVHGDAGIERNAIGTSGWAAAQVAGKYQLAPKLYAAIRGDYFREWVAEANGETAAAIFWPADWMASATGTFAVQPADGLSVRLEYRHDQSSGEVFFGGEVAGDGVATPFVPNRRRQDTVTLGAVAWF